MKKKSQLVNFDLGKVYYNFLIELKNELTNLLSQNLSEVEKPLLHVKTNF